MKSIIFTTSILYLCSDGTYHIVNIIKEHTTVNEMSLMNPINDKPLIPIKQKTLDGSTVVIFEPYEVHEDVITGVIEIFESAGWSVCK